MLDERAAGELVWMMSQVVERGTGTRARLPDGRPAAGKTGTTQAARDAWFIGFTADYVTGVWMGYDDNTPLSGTTGGGLPAEIWRETMVRVEDGLPIRPLPERDPRRRRSSPRPRSRGRSPASRPPSAPWCRTCCRASSAATDPPSEPGKASLPGSGSTRGREANAQPCAGMALVSG